MDISQKLTNFGKKIAEYKKVIASWQDENKILSQNEIKEEIGSLKENWGKYQSYYNILIEQAKYKQSVFKLEYIKAFDSVKAQFDETLEELLKLQSIDSEEPKDSNNGSFSIDEIDDLIHKSKTVCRLSERKRSKTPLLSSSTDKNCDKSPKRRRKTTHEIIRDDDDSMTFESCVISDNEINSNSEPSTSSSYATKDNTDIGETDEETIHKSMKYVAYLRSCVNYMMLNLGYRTIEFRRSSSLPWLMTQYHERKNNSCEQKMFENTSAESTTKWQSP